MHGCVCVCVYMQEKFGFACIGIYTLMKYAERLVVSKSHIED